MLDLETVIFCVFLFLKIKITATFENQIDWIIRKSIWSFCWFDCLDFFGWVSEIENATVTNVFFCFFAFCWSNKEMIGFCLCWIKINKKSNKTNAFKKKTTWIRTKIYFKTHFVSKNMFGRVVLKGLVQSTKITNRTSSNAFTKKIGIRSFATDLKISSEVNWNGLKNDDDYSYYWIKMNEWIGEKQ